MLHINDLTYRIAGRLLLEQATVAVSDYQRIGLVGRNGAGKSTLFRLILGEIAPESGTIS
ncbi:MAG: ATP-binding cassette domain-containing protein, partial [Rhodospirillales bacterium]